MLIRRMVLHMDSMHWAFKEGVLPTEIWEREAFVLRGWFNSDAGKATWRVGGWTESFRQCVESDVFQAS
jgi:endonuclease/exonuclease/phosphatase family metal-dependent hydrolase